MRTLRHIFLLLFCVLVARKSMAQTGIGSSTVDNSLVTITTGTVEQRFSENTYFGPNANWNIDGTLEIYSKNVWIAPGATFNGNGKIVIFNPGDNPFYNAMASGSTVIDGNNGGFINLLIENRNDKNLDLNDISDPGYATANPSGVASATLNIANTLNLAVDGANIILNGHNLAFNSTGKVTGYSRARMVVTGNSISGHVVKDYAGSDGFVFPVGIALQDYTPATITPNTAGKIYVSVQDYNASNTALKNKALGMDRMWNIYGSVTTKINMLLQHNAVTNGALFNDQNAGIGQYLGNSNYSLEKGSNPTVGLHGRNDILLPTNMTANSAYFTKLSVSGTNLFVPNLFTPNGDGNNDAFEIRGLSLFYGNNLVIVNRWGNEVYKSNSYHNDWTGEGLNEGTYFYKLNVKEAADSKWTTFTGYITLVRKFKN
ncbi:gliding motility-associated-like protein [Pedobacter sp. UYP30]|uniref:gliding motility-associated C-terminal domain-containing protein n=1 Tax=Pedobacter sp. UYP30 TaxID=1756400 RepID=UPI003390C294